MVEEIRLNGMKLVECIGALCDSMPYNKLKGKLVSACSKNRPSNPHVFLLIILCSGFILTTELGNREP